MQVKTYKYSMYSMLQIDNVRLISVTLVSSEDCTPGDDEVGGGSDGLSHGKEDRPQPSASCTPRSIVNKKDIL